MYVRLSVLRTNDMEGSVTLVHCANRRSPPMTMTGAPASRRLLTKSLFKTAVKCPRKLRYALNPQLYPRNNEANSLLTSLAEEGRKFEAYCRARCFDGGIEIGGASLQGLKFDASTDNGGYGINDAVIDDLVEQTRYHLLHDGPPTDGTHASNNNNTTTTLFEAAVRYENFFIRADVLRRHHDTNTLSLIEIKAKSWDSAKVAQGDNPMVGKRGGIKSAFLPYIHDVAFQKMVIEGAYPEYRGRVKAYLMMPDKSKRTMVSNLNGLVEDAMRGDDEARTQIVQAIDDGVEEDLSALVDVTQLAEDVIYDELVFPGSLGDAFVEVAEKWASLDDDSVSPPPIGSHCKSCEYRLKSGSSGFDLCWKEATGLEPEAFRPGTAVIDLWNGSKKDVTSFIDDGKYRLSDLTNQDLGFTDDGIEITKGGKPTNGFTRSRRQLFQASGLGTCPADGSQYEAVVTNADAEDENTLAKLTVPKLKDRLRTLKLKVGGRKADLITRLLEHRCGTSSSNGSTSERGLAPSSMGEESSAPQYILDEEYLRKEMNRWQYPYHFIDFETAMPALPYFVEMHPFDTVAFQFSHHILHEDGRVQHASQFLQTDPGICPNAAFLCALADALGDCNGSVFRWGIHENTVVAALLDAFRGPSDVPEKLQPLLLGEDRAMIDLMKTATLGYFVPGSDGSSSIKRLLSPTLESSSVLERFYGAQAYSSSNFADIHWFQRIDGSDSSVRDPYDVLVEYDKENGVAQNDAPLVVAEGGAAIAAYSVLQQRRGELSPEQRSAIETSLLRYCELDTLAMVMIVQAWQEFLDRRGNR